MNRFFLKFCVLLLVPFVLEFLMPVQTHVIEPFTNALAYICGKLLLVFDQAIIIHSNTLIDSHTQVGITIESGCNGVEACLILVAAILAYPATLRQQLSGILCGIAAVQGINIARLISLFYLAGWNRELFHFAHLYLWQGLIILDVLLVWLIWMRMVVRNAPRIAENE